MYRILADIADPRPIEPVSSGINMPAILLIAALVIIIGVAAFFIIKKIKKGK